MTPPTATLTVQKLLPCSAAEAYRAWTTPDLFQQWFVPASGLRATATMEVRPGGRYEIRFQRPNRPDPMVICGEFLVVDPPRYLEYTWRWAWDETPNSINRSVVKVTFAARGQNQTELSLTHEGFTDAEDQQNHTDGWTMILQCLAAAYPAT